MDYTYSKAPDLFRTEMALIGPFHKISFSSIIFQMAQRIIFSIEVFSVKMMHCSRKSIKKMDFRTCHSYQTYWAVVVGISKQKWNDYVPFSDYIYIAIHVNKRIFVTISGVQLRTEATPEPQLYTEQGAADGRTLLNW